MVNSSVVNNSAVVDFPVPSTENKKMILKMSTVLTRRSCNHNIGELARAGHGIEYRHIDKIWDDYVILFYENVRITDYSITITRYKVTCVCMRLIQNTSTLNLLLRDSPSRHEIDIWWRIHDCFF